MTSTGRGRRTAAVAALALLLAVVAAAPLGAQEADELAARCAAAGGDATMCALGAGAGRDLAGYVGILAGLRPGDVLRFVPATLEQALALARERLESLPPR